VEKFEKEHYDKYCNKYVCLSVCLLTSLINHTAKLHHFINGEVWLCDF